MQKKFEVEIHPDPCPDLIIEKGPINKGVGRWVPEQKHVFLAKYVGAAREAMKKWPNRVFIDPFCGPGRIQVEGEAFTRDGGALVAWRASVKGGAPFTRMLIGDLDKDRAEACAARLRRLGAPAEAFTGPANETVHRMIRSVPESSLCLAYIDPYNLEYLSMEIIDTLAKLKTIDFALHFSTMDLMRNVDFELDPERARFDDAAPNWRTALKSISRSSLPGAFFNYWCEMIRIKGFTFSKEMPLVHNNTNHAIYRLVFFARHNLANKIWGDVAKSPNRELDF